MPDQDGGKLATVRQDDGDEFYHVTMGGNIGRPLILFSSRHESLANNFCDNVNTAHQAALTAERKRVLEMVIKEIGADSGFPELASTIRALLSRLEGEGGKQ